MTKKTTLILLALALVALHLPSLNARSLKEEKDFAVPAFSDFFVLGGTKISVHPISGPMTQEDNFLPDLNEIRKFDINRDLRLNDFDFKQFEAIVEKLEGTELSGEELIERFRFQQKSQADDFPMIYDLDRDGKFTPFDVDYFTELIGSLRNDVPGGELIKKFRERIFPEQDAS